MLLFVGDLIDVKTGDYNSLVFRSEKYDFGLGEVVPCSQSIGITEETMKFLDSYKKSIGQKITIAVNAIVTKNKTVYFMSQSDILAVDKKQ